MDVEQYAWATEELIRSAEESVTELEESLRREGQLSLFFISLADFDPSGAYRIGPETLGFIVYSGGEIEWHFPKGDAAFANFEQECRNACNSLHDSLVRLLTYALAHGMDIAAVGTGGDAGHGPARALYEALGGRWQVRWLPWALIVGAALATSAYWYVASQGLSDNPAPRALWIWVGLSGFAAAVLVVGWRGTQWWRRGVSLAAVPLCVVCAGLALNIWVGYFQTVQSAWNQLTAGPLPDETDQVFSHVNIRSRRG